MGAAAEAGCGGGRRGERGAAGDVGRSNGQGFGAGGGRRGAYFRRSFAEIPNIGLSAKKFFYFFKNSLPRGPSGSRQSLFPENPTGSAGPLTHSHSDTRHTHTFARMHSTPSLTRPQPRPRHSHSDLSAAGRRHPRSTAPPPPRSAADDPERRGRPDLQERRRPRRPPRSAAAAPTPTRRSSAATPGRQPPPLPRSTAAVPERRCRPGRPPLPWPGAGTAVPRHAGGRQWCRDHDGLTLLLGLAVASGRPGLGRSPRTWVSLWSAWIWLLDSEQQRPDRFAVGCSLLRAAFLLLDR